MINDYKRWGAGTLMWSGILFAGAVLLSAIGADPGIQALAKETSKPVKYGKIDIRANDLDYFEYGSPSKKLFGRLKYLGGLSLLSSHSEFGGISGMSLGPDGRQLIAVTDDGNWITGELVYKATKPVGVRLAKISPLKALNGRSLKRKRQKDAEGIVFLNGSPRKGTVLISFERTHRIGRFPVSTKGVGNPRSYLPFPKALRGLKRNKGLEAITVLKGGRYKGRVLAFAERKISKDGHLKGWILLGKKAKPLLLKRIGGFDVTDLASLPNGDVLVLERRFRWSEGIQMRLRLIPVGALKPGGVITGETLLEADGGYTIDNMEGMAVHQSKSGNTIITLISDDNFSILQRTLLLQFELLKSAKKVTARR